MHPDAFQPISSPDVKTKHGSLMDGRGVRKLQRSFERLEQQKRDLLTKLSQWPEGERHLRPASRSWSALDVMDHLVKVEYESLAVIRATLPKGHPVRFQERIRARIVFAVMVSPLRIKVPAAVVSVLPGESAVEATITTRWLEVRHQMKLLLDNLEPTQLTLGLFHHPVSGWMTVPDALTFFSVHLTHHGYQLTRIRASLAKHTHRSV